MLFSCAKSFVRNNYRSSRENSNSAVISHGFVYCFWLMMQIFVKQSTWLVHMWCVYSVDLKVGNKNISLVARLSHLGGCFWLFVSKFWEVVGTFVWYFVILRMQVQWWGHSNSTWLFELFALTGSRDEKSSGVTARDEATWWYLHYLIYFIGESPCRPQC